MEIVRVEPTPSPNTMKIVLSEKREDNQSNTYTEVRENQPQFINDLLKLEGVKIHLLCDGFPSNRQTTKGQLGRRLTSNHFNT